MTTLGLGLCTVGMWLAAGQLIPTAREDRLLWAVAMVWVLRIGWLGLIAIPALGGIA